MRTPGHRDLVLHVGVPGKRWLAQEAIAALEQEDALAGRREVPSQERPRRRPS
jgi:hypothetical protein